ncbi:uncharacterized protein AAG666_011056 isoform 1-T1 [Megaptera novaeangliae]
MVSFYRIFRDEKVDQQSTFKSKINNMHQVPIEPDLPFKSWEMSKPPDTAMSICCAPHTCSGQAGVPGNGVQHSVEAAFKLAAEPARMVLTVRAVVCHRDLAHHRIWRIRVRAALKPMVNEQHSWALWNIFNDF